VTVTVDLSRCDGNAACVGACAFSAIEVRDGKAVVYDNCTDCAACVLACPTNAIWSDVFSAPARAGLLAIDFTTSSGIARIVDRAARGADISAVWMLASGADASATADAIARTVKSGEFSLTVLPHRGAGPAIAARVAATIGANLLSGCSDLRIDDNGGVRAVVPHYGGVVKAQARCAPGTTVATLRPRAMSMIAATPLEIEASPESARVSDAPREPAALARRIAVLDPGLSKEAGDAARAAAAALGALVASPDQLGIKPLSPDLVVTFGVTGSTEINAALRNSRVLVAVVDDANAMIVQVADYVLVGEVGEHAKALVAAL